jgi:translation initiation factor IF-1
MLGNLNVKVEREDILKMMNGMGTKLPHRNMWILPDENIHIQVNHILEHKI